MNTCGWVLELSEESFAQHVANSEKPVVLVFWQDGCARCNRVLKLLRDSASRVNGKLLVALISKNQSSTLAARFGITSVPTLLCWHRGSVCYEFVGELSRSELEDITEKLSLLNRAGEEQNQTTGVVSHSRNPGK